ncbi:MAG: flagellar basal body P-ring formation chaperone FlgA [Bdellovibrionales bacterium]
MKKTTRILFTSWLVLSGSAGSPTPCIADTPVTLRPDVEITRATVKLSDLFTGVPAGIDRDIAQAPPPCKPALYDENVLTKLAKTYRLDWQESKESNRVTVSSACTRISSDMIRKEVVAKIKANSNAKKTNFEVVFDKRNLEVLLPTKDDQDFRLEAFSYDQSNKLFRATLTAQTPQGSYVLPITGRILVKRSIPVLARRLESGSIIGSNDLDWTDVPEERVSADIVTETSQLIGREVRHDMPEGDVVRSRDVIPPRLVQRGALVTMRIETPNILITAQGKAQQDGAEGETVRVINTQSNRLVEGIVVAPGVVEIRIAQKVALAE